MWIVTYSESYCDYNHSEFETKEEALEFIRAEIVSTDLSNLKLYQRVPVEITVTL
jgi:hypothetical protein